MGKLIETRSIPITRMEQDSGGYRNEIKLSADDDLYTRTLASESELHRILIHLDGRHNENKSGYDIVPGLFTLDVGKNKHRYNALMEHDGKINLTTATGTETYISTFCGAGHARTQKNLFVSDHFRDKLDDIILCGIPKDLKYGKSHKWNAYYALVTTDSQSVTYMPNIVVVPDYKKTVTEQCDLVDVTGHGIDKEYTVHNDQPHDIEIIPFDGAGLVTPQCAARWAMELGCRQRKNKHIRSADGGQIGSRYIPSGFQIRCLPAYKGMLFTFDLLEFAREHGTTTIKDISGREWDLVRDKIDVIVTQSQFKFWNLYLDDNGEYDHNKWKSAFNEPTHGYRRKMNIASYTEHPDDLRNKTMLSYQPLQSLDFTDSEVDAMVSDSVKAYERIVGDLDAFFLYRRLTDMSDNGNVVDNADRYTPPYYIALMRNRELIADRYIQRKISTDIKRLRDNLLSGKQIVGGNYQTFVPDLYGLAQWAFGLEVTGLLREPYQIYSRYWTDRNVKTVDIMRNPHIGMEHRIGRVTDTAEMKKWYRFQTSGIVCGMYDTLALALNGADWDGDTVCTTDDINIIHAVQRQMDCGHGRLTYKVGDSGTEKKTEIDIRDTARLMQINADSFKNSIGSVIDRVTDLWSLINTDDRVRDYIKIGAVVGAETIDFAKTGENARFPDDVLSFLKGKKRGYWMRYLKKQQENVSKTDLAVKRAEKLGKCDDEIEKVRDYCDYDCTMDRLCHCAERKIEIIDRSAAAKYPEDAYIYRNWLTSSPPVNRNIKRKLLELQDRYCKMAKTGRRSDSYDKKQLRDSANRYRWFYEECRTELLFIEPNIDRLLDMMIMIYYTDKAFVDCKREKDLLWNAFPMEMISRCTGDTHKKVIDYEKIKVRHEKNIAIAEKQSANRAKKKKISIPRWDRDMRVSDRNGYVTKGDRTTINKVITSNPELRIRKGNEYKLKRLLAILLFFSRKQSDNPRYITIANNSRYDLTFMALEKLTDVNHKSMISLIKWLEDVGLLSTKITKTAIKVMVRLPSSLDVSEWISTDDYNKAGTQIRDYFRKECRENGEQKTA